MTAPTDRKTSEAAKVLADPTAYADDERLHAGLTWLRANEPVAWVDGISNGQRVYRPFWAVTKHADIMDIERDNELWISAPRPLLMPVDLDAALMADRKAGTGLETLIHMDDPHHRDVRKIGADWFRPSVLKKLKARCDELAKIWVDKMAEKGPDRDRGQLPALRDPHPAGPAGVGLPTHAQAHPGDVRRQRRGVPARR